MTKTTDQPIAIVGMAFRFPGDISDEQSFWQALAEGRDLVSEIDKSRWATGPLQHPKRSEPGRSVTFAAGTLSRIDTFDAAFFGISAREATSLDPQQRLLLELAWEALEEGGHVPERLAGSKTAVYVGMSSLDYGVRAVADLSSLSSHFMTGNTLSLAANRLSYVFDFHGPSFVVDTACSSALVALHQACASLRRGEAPFALVGSVNLLMHPYPFIGFTKASMISARGRCRAFDASADGYVRAEGGAVLALKPLDQAQADGDKIHAVILASGVNADGSRKTGITIPSPSGQAELMRAVAQQAGVTSEQVSYVEAHGTGTAVGDPVEAQAIGEVYGQGRRAALPIGSVKTNLGHMEAASGMAGLIKAIEVLKHRQIPPLLHLEIPNPAIDFRGLGIDPVAHLTPLKAAKVGPLIAGVNSFGFGGANAHFLIQAWDSEKKAATETPLLPPLFLSAQTPEALSALAGSYASLLQDEEISFYDVAWSAAFHRQHLENRLAVKGQNRAEIVDALQTLAQSETPQGIVIEKALVPPAEVAFVYAGNGAQWVGMGQTLWAESPRFAEILIDLDARMKPQGGFSLLDELSATVDTARLDDTTIAQPLLFALQVATTVFLRDQGIVPHSVTGHSVGEVAAAWAAGALDLDSAIRVILARSAAQGRTRGHGRMAAVGLSDKAIQEILETERLSTIEIAGINSPTNVTLAGCLEDLTALQKKLAGSGVFFRLLDLDYAFHSRAMEPIRAELLAALKGLKPQSTSIPFISTVTGAVLDGVALGADYWWDNVRQPVKFWPAIQTLIGQGASLFVEITPHAILQRYLTESLSAAQVKGRVLATGKKGDESLARLKATALRILLSLPHPDLKAYFPLRGRFVNLPFYPWQRETFWLQRTSDYTGGIERSRVHPLLGWKLDGQVWENTLDTLTTPWLRDHKVGGAVIFPAAAYVEMGLAASHETRGEAGGALEDLDILSPLLFEEDHARALRLEMDSDGTFRILSRPRLSEDSWILHAKGRVLEAPKTEIQKEIEDWSGTILLDAATHYKLTESLGLDYGAAFQGFLGGWLMGDRLQARIALPKALQEEAAAYQVHPALLDLCFQSLMNFFRAEMENGSGIAYLPVRVGSVRFFGGMPVSFEAHLTRKSRRALQASFVLRDSENRIIACLDDCRFRAAPLHRAPHEPACWRTALKLLPHPSEETNAVVGDTKALIDAAAQALRDAEPLLKRDQYFGEALPLMQALIASFAFRAFDSFAASEPTAFQQRLNEKQGLFQILAACLEEAGLLQKKDGVWELLSTNAPPEPESIWRTILAEFPSCLPDLLPIGRRGMRLLDDLRTGAALPALLAFTEISLVWQGVPTALASILRKIVKDLPTNRRLRILDTSASGSLLSLLLPILPKNRTDYVIAASAEKLEPLRADYGAHPFVRLLVCDEGGFFSDPSVPKIYDLTFVQESGNASTLSTRVASLRPRLAANGLLILAAQPPSHLASFLRGTGFIGIEAAQKRLEAYGFAGVESFVEEADRETATGAYLLLARNPERAEERVTQSPQNWLFLGEDLGDALAARLKESGACVLEQSIESFDLATARQVLGGLDHVVYRATSAEDSPETNSLQALSLVQALVQNEENKPKLWFVTRGGALTAERPKDWCIDPTHAALWGFGRVVRNEHPDLGCTLIDLAVDPVASDSLERLAREFWAPDGETEIILAPQGRYGVRVECTDLKPEPLSDSFRLDFQTPGQLGNLGWHAQETRALAPDEIDLHPHAVGLNFRDVMYAMGLLPDEAVEKGFAGATLGLECAGTIRRVGADVTQYKEGDSVMGFGSACFASTVITKAHAVAPKPEGWSFTDAATVPTAFFTVYYALKHLAQIQKGERILIHGAAGGVGIAAIQIARAMGAKIFATAGSEEKRDFAKLAGVDHVFDSRSLAFAEEILTLTQGEGVDVVLNSLAGEAVNRNLRVLKPFGRFLELGKRDFYENTRIGLRPFRDNISYFGIDADQLLTTRPALAARLFQEMMALFNQGILTPLPAQIFQADHVIEAFRTMQQAKHIGKIVVHMEGAAPSLSDAPRYVLPKLKKDGSYLVTGGLDGFGFETARWLAECGAGHLILLSRRGMKTPDATARVAILETLGAQVYVFACDVSDRVALTDILKKIHTDLPPLCGILHAAMVLDDGLIANLDAERCRKVLLPKIHGAWALHKLTQDHALDFFVLYSSVTTLLGNPGQANYVAANAFLESLTALRRQQGLPATCIGWGPIGDSGYLTRNETVKESLASRLGAPALKTQAALTLLGEALTTDAGVVTVADFSLGALARLLPIASSPLFETLRRTNPEKAESDEGAMDLRALLAGKTPEEVRALLQETVRKEAAKILCLSPERMDPSKSLNDLGMDSLMAVEMALALEQKLGIPLPAMALSESGGSIEKLSAKLAEKLSDQPSDSQTEDLTRLVTAMAARHADALSAEEVAATVLEIEAQMKEERVRA